MWSPSQPRSQRLLQSGRLSTRSLVSGPLSQVHSAVQSTMRHTAVAPAVSTLLTHLQDMTGLHDTPQLQRLSSAFGRE
ncbi:hypothetical protein KIPB_014017, partial [Kipferlia bialata]|eukprot:g14017.t1